MIPVPTYIATIYLGRRAGYKGPIKSEADVWKLIQEYVNRIGLCVSVTPNVFIYKDGIEPGHAIGLINYPRFPSTSDAIDEKAIELAKILKKACGQLRVSIVTSRETFMLGPEDDA